MTVATLPAPRGLPRPRGTHAPGQRVDRCPSTRRDVRSARGLEARERVLGPSGGSSRCSPRCGGGSERLRVLPRRSPAARGCPCRPESSIRRDGGAFAPWSFGRCITISLHLDNQTIECVRHTILLVKAKWFAYRVVGETSSRADPVLSEHGFAGKLRAPMLQHRARVGSRNQGTKPMHDNDRTGHKSPYGSDVSPLLTNIVTCEVNR